VVVIPDAVRSTVLARIQRLDAEARAVLMRASVIGRRFDLAILVATASSPEARVRSALDSAMRMQLIVRDGGAGERFSFRHALTRDIVYAELQALGVRPLHRRIVRALERAAACDDVPLEDLAYHAWAAVDARRALRYNERAGDAAAELHALADARTHYARARSVVDVGSAPFLRLSEKLRTLDAQPS
jgi:predicted ATPase